MRASTDPYQRAGYFTGGSSADRAIFKRLALYYRDYGREFQHNYSTLEQEWGNIAAGFAAARSLEEWQVVIDYARHLTAVWFARGHYKDAEQGYRWMRDAARALDNGQEKTFALLQWGCALMDQGDWDEAELLLSQCLEAATVQGDKASMADALYQLARVNIQKGYITDAVLYQNRESERLYQECGNHEGQARALYGQARIFYRRRNYPEAARLLHQGLNVQPVETENRVSIEILRLLTDVALATKDQSGAEQYSQQALALCQKLNDTAELPSVLYLLSQVERIAGRLASAHEYAQQALASFKRLGRKASIARGLLQLSAVERDLKDYEAAFQSATASLELYRELGNRGSIMLALREVAHSAHQLGQRETACQYWREALTYATGLDDPMSGELRSYLAQWC